MSRSEGEEIILDMHWLYGEDTSFGFMPGVLIHSLDDLPQVDPPGRDRG